jgi:hypothetical protein
MRARINARINARMSARMSARTRATGMSADAISISKTYSIE